jgi:hypothetical protein
MGHVPVPGVPGTAPRRHEEPCAATSRRFQEDDMNATTSMPMTLLQDTRSRPVASQPPLDWTLASVGTVALTTVMLWVTLLVS